MKKVVAISVLLIMFVAIINCNTVTASEIMNTINKQVNLTANENVANSVKSITGSIITITKVICAGVAVAMLSILGIKYMMGSAEEKSGYQKSFVPLIVGIVVVAAATQIATMVFSAFN